MASLASEAVASARGAVRATLAGDAVRAFALAGSQPHARAARSESYDLFNDVLLALQDARAAGKKVAFVNLEAEHPPVIEQYFLQDPMLLFVSLHESPLFLYPQTGVVQTIGAGEGKGYTVNLPMPPGAGDGDYLAVWEQVAEPLLSRFAPDLIVLLMGSSAHLSEPLAHLRLSSMGYQTLLERLLPHAPRLVLLGGGGGAIRACPRDYGCWPLPPLPGG